MASKPRSTTPDEMQPLPVVFDTSILHGIRPDAPTPEFRVLMRLREAGKLSLLVPEMSAKEWLSQRVEADARSIDTLQSALTEFRQRACVPELPSSIVAKVDALLHPETLSAIRDHAKRWQARHISQLGLSVIKLQAAQLQGWLDDYFEGAPPFGAKKSRKDIPDAMVFASVVKAHADDARVIFACSDARLRDAAEAKGIRTAEALPDLLRHDSVSSLHSNPTFALWWETAFKEIVSTLRSREADLEQLIMDKLERTVSGVTIRARSIPEDNCEADVQWADDIGNLQFGWEEAESLGEGVLTIPVAFQALLGLEFSVYRGDAFDVPDWVDVSVGDFENEHYFEASGSRRGAFTARLVFEFAESIEKKEPAVADAELSVQDTEFKGFAD